MSLTKEDFKEIRAIVKEEINTAIEEQDIRIGQAFANVQDQLNVIDNRLDDIQNQINDIDCRLADLENEVKSLRQDLNITKSAVEPVIQTKRKKDNAYAEIARIEKQLENLKRSLAAA
jgi:archaellum component FlaC